MGGVGGLGLLVSVEPVQEVGQVGGGELPLEGSGRAVVADLETGKALLDHGEVREVVGRERFSLDDGEVDLYLVEPRRMDRGVHHDRIGELLGEPVDGPLNIIAHRQGLTRYRRTTPQTRREPSNKRDCSTTVSYTHLTLPTNREV